MLKIKRLKSLTRILFSRQCFILCALLVLIATGIIVYAQHAIVDATKQRTWNDVQTIPARSVGLVLGAKPGNRYFNRRIDAAADLYRAGKVKWLLVSGDNGNKHYDEPSAMQQALIAKGVPENAIFCDYAGFSTLDSVVRTHDVFGENRITIISQQFHNQRAIWLAQQYGIDAIGYNAKDLNNKHGRYTQLREKLARVSALLDAKIFHKQPKYLGPRIVIQPNVSSGCPATPAS